MLPWQLHFNDFFRTSFWKGPPGKNDYGSHVEMHSQGPKKIWKKRSEALFLVSTFFFASNLSSGLQKCGEIGFKIANKCEKKQGNLEVLCDKWVQIWVIKTQIKFCFFCRLKWHVLLTHHRVNAGFKQNLEETSVPFCCL